jgi:hypothetical protein
MRIAHVCWLALCASPLPALAQPNLEGVWDVDRSLPERWVHYAEPQLTPEGARLRDAYDPFVDDPSVRCTPSGAGRVWDEPDTAFQIEQFSDHVVIRYEMFDLVRTIALRQPGVAGPSTVNIHGRAMPSMGHSVGHYDGDALVLETQDYAPGYITTLVEFSGYLIPQSSALHGTERIYRSGAGLAVDITYVDPVMLTQPLAVKYLFSKSKFQMTEYGCDAEDQ